MSPTRWVFPWAAPSSPSSKGVSSGARFGYWENEAPGRSGVNTTRRMTGDSAR
jgi:hypothetical protein